MEAPNRFDYIVIGAGSSGCVIASRLTENAAVRVLLLEAGGRDTKPEIHDSAAFTKLWGSDVDWKYQTEPEPHMGNRQIQWPRGKVLGGSSSINALLYVRGNRRDYDAWGRAAAGWSYEDVLPYFRKSENYDGGENVYHGVGGPLNVKQKLARESAPAELAFIQACIEHGFAGPNDFSGAQQEEAAGYHQITVNPDGTRCSAARAFLTPFLDRANLAVGIDAHVTRLLIENGRVVGVEYVRDNVIERAYADSEVIVCAGAVDSPKLLMLSGIGPAATLREHGINVVADVPGVGQNLKDHLLVGVASFSQKPWLEDRNILGEAGLFTYIKADREAGGPDLQFHFRHDFHLASPDIVGVLDGRGITFAPTLVKPQSTGYLTLRSNDPFVAARIHANYLSDDTDLQVLIGGIKLARELLTMPAFDSFRGEEVAPGAACATDDDMRQFIRRYSNTLFHPAGTCIMGSDERAVVDADLKVRGVSGLRVADASIMPQIVSGNTNAACIMIGEKAADLVRGIHAAQN